MRYPKPEGAVMMVDQELAAQIRRRLGVGAHPVVDEIALAVALLAPLGWAFCSNWHAEGTRRAVAAAADGADTHELDDMITEMWNTDNATLLRQVGAPLRAMASGENVLNQVMWGRAELIDKAVHHHENGAYEASVPIIHAQIEGITRDLTNQSFFSKSQPSSYLDDETLAGLDSNLPVVRQVFSEDIKVSGYHGSLSRHGVAHGRDVGYATRVNSTKALVLMAGLVEFFPKLARLRADEARLEHEASVAGSTELDDHGRLVDDRHVPEVLDFGFEFEAGYSRAILLHERFDLAAAVRRASVKAKLAVSGFTYGQDGTGVWWSYRIPAGQVLAAAARPSTSNTRRFPDTWRWDHPEPPEAAPWIAPNGWHDCDCPPAPPNWEPRLSMLDGL